MSNNLTGVMIMAKVKKKKEKEEVEEVKETKKGRGRSKSSEETKDTKKKKKEKVEEVKGKKKKKSKEEDDTVLTEEMIEEINNEITELQDNMEKSMRFAAAAKRARKCTTNLQKMFKVFRAASVSHWK